MGVFVSVRGVRDRVEVEVGVFVSVRGVRDRVEVEVGVLVSVRDGNTTPHYHIYHALHGNSAVLSLKHTLYCTGTEVQDSHQTQESASRRPGEVPVCIDLLLAFCTSYTHVYTYTGG